MKRDGEGWKVEIGGTEIGVEGEEVRDGGKKRDRRWWKAEDSEIQEKMKSEGRQKDYERLQEDEENWTGVK